MANEKIEIDIVLNDGSIAKGFAQINKEAQKTSGILQNAFSVFGGIELSNAFNKLSDSVKGLFTDSIKEAIEAQNAINDLASSFKSAGFFSESAVNSFKEFASVVQENTVIADDQVIALGALAANYAKTEEQVIQLTAAAIELSARTGDDLSSSIEQLGGTLNGIPGRLGKIIPGFKSLSEESLKSGAALDLVLERFGGSAVSKISTYEGGIAQLKNQFSDFLENIGNLVVRSPALVAVFNTVSDLFKNFSESVKTLNSDNKDLLGPILVQALQFGLSFNAYVIKPVEVLTGVFKVVYNVAKQFFDYFLSGIGKISGAAGKLISFFDSKNSIASALLTFEESTAKTYEDQVRTTAEAGAKAFDTGFGDGVEATLVRIQNSVAAASKKLLPEIPKGDFANNDKITKGLTKPIVDASLQYQIEVAKIKGNLIILRDQLQVIGESSPFANVSENILNLKSVTEIAAIDSIGELEKLKTQFEDVKNKAIEATNQISEAVRTGLTNAISNGVQSLTDALLKGGNAFKAFAGAALSTVGDLMIQIGTQIVLTSKAIAALSAALTNPLTGAGLGIAAGIGLIAAGIFVKGIASKLGGSAAAPGSSLTSPGTPATPISGGDSGGISGGLEKKPAGVQVIVQGNIFDSEATGLRIANLLKDQGFTNAVVT